MTVETWQSWMELLPCDRCGWMPEDCPCRAGVPASPPPPPINPVRALRVLTLDERRAALIPLTIPTSSIPAAGVPVLDVIAAVAAEQVDERKDGAA